MNFFMEWADTPAQRDERFAAIGATGKADDVARLIGRLARRQDGDLERIRVLAIRLAAEFPNLRTFVRSAADHAELGLLNNVVEQIDHPDLDSVIAARIRAEFDAEWFKNRIAHRR